MRIVVPRQVALVLVKNGYNYRQSMRLAPRPQFPLSGALMGYVGEGPVRPCSVVFAGKKCVARGWPEATLSG